MASTPDAGESNPFRPPELDPVAARPEERALLLAYRRTCLEHENFQRCVGLADLLCAGIGTVFVVASAGILIYLKQNNVAAAPFEMFRWVVGRFVLLPALIALLVALGINLPRRRLWAWRAQILLSGLVVVFVAVNWMRFRSSDRPIWYTASASITVLAHAAIVAVFVSKRGFRIIAPRYESIVEATPSLSQRLGARAIAGAVFLAAAIGLGLLVFAIWLSWQAAIVLQPIAGHEP
jgi:hypothetical protein